MKINYVLLMSLLIVGLLFVPAVSAEEYNFVLDDSKYIEQSLRPDLDSNSRHITSNIYYLYILNASEVYGNELLTLYSQNKRSYIANYDELPQSAWTKVTIGDFMIADFGYFKYKTETEDYLQCNLINIEYIDDYPTGLTGKQKFLMVPDDPDFVFPRSYGYQRTNLIGDYSLKFAFGIIAENAFDSHCIYSIFTKIIGHKI